MKRTTKNEAHLSPNTHVTVFVGPRVGTVPFGATLCRHCRLQCTCVRAEVCGLRICTRYDRLSQQQLSFLYCSCCTCMLHASLLCHFVYYFWLVFRLNCVMNIIRLCVCVRIWLAASGVINDCNIQYFSLLRLRTFRDGTSATIVQLGVYTYESS